MHLCGCCGLFELINDAFKCLSLTKDTWYRNESCFPTCHLSDLQDVFICDEGLKVLNDYISNALFYLEETMFKESSCGIFIPLLVLKRVV